MASAMAATHVASGLSRTVLACVVLLGLVASGCADGPGGGDVGVVAVPGDLELRTADVWETAGPEVRIKPGMELRTGDLEARLALDDGELWLAPGTAARVHDDHVELLQGDVLVRADRRLAITWDSVGVHGAGVFRMRLGSSPRVGVYEGQATVARPGEQTIVDGLREVSFAGRRLPATQPLGYRSEDPWDAAWMDAALQLDAETSRLARGIERSYGEDPLPTGFYAQFAPDASEAMGVLARTARVRGEDGAFGPPADTLLTLFVAQATERQPLDGAVRDVLALRSEGARWGLIGVAMQVSTDRLAAVVDLGHAQHVAAADPGPATRATAPPATPPAGNEPAPPGGSPPATPPPAPREPDGPPPGDDPEEPGDNPPFEDLGEPLRRLLEDAADPLGLLLGVD